MPRIRREETDNASYKLDDIEEDYLDVDKPLSGQNYYCISFVSPEKILAQKEQFMFYHYERAVSKRVFSTLDETLSKLIEKSTDGTVDLVEIISLKKTVANLYKDEDISMEQYKNKFEDFKFQNEEKIGEEFDKNNKFRTSVRGVKVRGVFDSKREADIRAAVLQRQDSLFDVFVGQVGYWCPWDPNPQKIDDIEYMNTDLNKLVKEYKSNEAKKDMFYQEQKSQRQKDSLSAEDRLKHQEGLKDMNAYRDSLQKQKDNAAINSESAEAGSDGLIKLNTISGRPTLDSILNISDGLDGLDGLGSLGSLDNVSKISQAITQSLETGTNECKEITLEDETKVLMSDDPWLQRKMSESK